MIILGRSGWLGTNKQPLSTKWHINMELTHMASHTLQVPVLVCPYRVRRKVAESTLAAQHPFLGKQPDQVCKVCTDRGAWQIPSDMHSNIPRSHSALHSRFSFYSDIKGLCFACSFPELK